MTQQSALPTAQDAKRRLAVPDYINIGVFSALYFMIVALCALASNIAFGVAGNLLLPAFAALLAGPVFMLLNARVRAFGAITTMGVVLGLFLFVSGHFATGGAPRRLRAVLVRLRRPDPADLAHEGRLYREP